MTDQVLDANRLFAESLAAQQRRDWDRAYVCWNLMRKVFPDHPAGHSGSGLALAQLKRLDEADNILTPAFDKFAQDAGVAVEYARVAHRRADWPDALRRWQAVHSRFPKNADAIAGLGTALQLTDRLDEADPLLRRGVTDFPSHAGIAVEFARVAHRRRDWEDALIRWRSVVEKFPENVEGILGVSVALRELQRFTDLDKLLLAAIARFPDDERLAIEYARSAHLQKKWRSSVERWNAARKAFPNSQDIVEGLGYGIYQAQVHELDELLLPTDVEEAAEEQEPPSINLSSSELMMKFESLGSGCEFGLVQRRYGAEPLGLLRWGAIPPVALASGLSERFCDLANPTTVKLFEFGDSREYFFRDEKYMLETHTFIPAQSADYAKVFSQQCRRAKYLRDKLLNDLDSSTDFGKILVYKRHIGRLSDSEASAIYDAVRAFGKHTLLCLRPEDEKHPNGLVELAADGLMFGYIDSLSETSDAKAIKYESWFRICVQAFTIYSKLNT